MQEAHRRVAVLCIGAIVEDTLAISESPFSAGDDLPGTVVRRIGGVAANVAMALAHRGTSATMLGAVGTDATGDRLLAALTDVGVDPAAVIRMPGASDQVVTLENPDGERFGAVADCKQLEAMARMNAAQVTAAATAWQDLIMIDGNLPPTCIATVLQTTASRATLVPASGGKAAQLGALISDFGPAIIANRTEAELITNQVLGCSRTAALALRDLGARAATVTDGRHDAAMVTEEGVYLQRPPAVRVVSTTGAGDAFVAGLLGTTGPSSNRLAAALESAADHLRSQ